MSDAEVHADWRMLPAEWEELRAALWAAAAEWAPAGASSAFRFPYVRRLAEEGKLGDPPVSWPPRPRPAVNGSGDVVPVPREHLAWLFLLAARATAGDPL